MCSGEQQILGAFWKAAAATLKATFQGLAGDALKQGQVCLLWSAVCADTKCEEGSETPSCTQALTYIPLHYERPWRPTLLTMNIEKSNMLVEGRLQVRMGAAAQEGYVDMSVGTVDDGVPDFMTPGMFVAKLHLEVPWTVTTLKLSNRSSPYPATQGLARARVSGGQQRFWEGRDVENQNRKHLDEEGKQEPDDHDNAGSDGDVNFEKLLEDCVGALWPSRSEGASSRSTSSSSSSSSTSGSSSSSSSSADGPSATCANSSLAGMEEQQASAEASHPPASVPRQRQPETFSWGEGFFFTHRASPPAWQALCRFHKSHPRCTKTCGYASAEESELVLRKLKFWCLKAATTTSKAAHCGPRGTPELSPEEQTKDDTWLEARMAELGAPPS